MTLNRIKPKGRAHVTDGARKQAIAMFGEDQAQTPIVAGWNPKATAKRHARNKVARKSRRTNRKRA